MNELVAAYAATDYRVFAEPPFVMKVGQHCPQLEELLEREGAECAFFLTAYNPFSQSKTDQENEAANESLRQQLGPNVLAGAGRDPSGKWPQEKSYLVWGDESPERAYSLARQYGQNAFLWIQEDCKPMLLISNKAMMSEQDILIEYNLTVGQQWRSRHVPVPAPKGSGLDFESFVKRFHEQV